MPTATSPVALSLIVAATLFLPLRAAGQDATDLYNSGLELEPLDPRLAKELQLLMPK